MENTNEIELLKMKINNLESSEEARITYEKSIKHLLKDIGKCRAIRLMKELNYIKVNYVTGEVKDV